ncbi:MAG: hypothetical protein AAFX79_02995 [Planctomycetota bacterium]
MHDLDYMEPEMSDLDIGLEDDEFGEIGMYGEDLAARSLTDAQLNELAADLLAVSDDEEMEQFLGKLVKNVAKGAGRFLKSGAGKALTGTLKGVAKAALPTVGSALGSLVLPGVGTAIGGQLGSAVGSLFEAEVEGLSPEDQEFEIARRVVKLAEVATKDAVKHPESPAAAKQAVKKAIAKVAPSAAEVGVIAQDSPLSDDDLDEIVEDLLSADSDDELGDIINGVRRFWNSDGARRVWSFAKPTLVAAAKGAVGNIHDRTQSWLDAQTSQELAMSDPAEATRQLVSIVNEAATNADQLSAAIPPKKAAAIALKRAAKNAASKSEGEFGGLRGYGSPSGGLGQQRSVGFARARGYRRPGYASRPYGRSGASHAQAGRWYRRGSNIILAGV